MFNSKSSIEGCQIGDQFRSQFLQLNTKSAEHQTTREASQSQQQRRTSLCKARAYLDLETVVPTCFSRPFKLCLRIVLLADIDIGLFVQ